MHGENKREKAGLSWDKKTRHDGKFPVARAGAQKLNYGYEEGFRKIDVTEGKE